MQGQLMNTLTQLEQHTQRTATQQEEQQRQLATHNQRAVQHLTASVDQSIAQVSAQTTSLLNTLVRIVENQQQAANETVHATHAAITRIGSVTNSAIADMNQGAENLMVAAREFSKAGQSVSGALGETAGVAAKLSMSADAMSTATRSIGDIVSDYGMIRQQLNEMIQSLKSVVEAARKEASLTTDVLARIDNAAQKLAVAQNQADHYLDQVTDVLQQTHQAFASGMRHTLEEANQQFFHHLTAATSKLREAIEELEVTLSSVGDRITRS
jgi:dsDNA-specific endonuclease/ATPase MutS2